MDQQIDIALIGGYLAHFREGVYHSLQCRRNMRVVICAEPEYSGSYIEPGSQNTFPYKRIQLIRLQLPVSRHRIVINPYLVSSIVSSRFKAVITSNYLGDITVWMGLLISRLFRRRVILWGHNLADSKTKMILRKMQMHLANAIILYTEGMRDEWINLGIKQEKLFVAYNALNTDLIEKIKVALTDEQIDQFKREQGLAERKVIIYVGRLIAAKKPLLMIETMKAVRSKHPDTLLVVIGDGPLYQLMKDRIVKEELGDNIRLVGPVHDEALLAKYFLSSHIGLMPSWAGLFIQHAFGYCLPVITDDSITNHPPEIELLKDGVNGIRYRSDDANDLAEAISRLFGNEDLRRGMGEAGYSIVQEKYNLQKMRDGIFHAIDYCLRNR